MSRPARSHRRPRPSPTLPGASIPLRSPDDALRVVLAAIAQPPEAETIVLLLDPTCRGSVCLVCRGATTADQVASLVPLLVQAAANEPSVGAVVLATVRPGLGVVVGGEDQVGFGVMRQDLADAGIDLLDWFVLDGEVIVSVAELSGACWRWPGEEPPW
jgi:hypothetical protein